jgi:hypothetical protein
LSGDSFADETNAADPPREAAADRFVVDRPNWLPAGIPSLDFAVASALVTASIDVGFDRAAEAPANPLSFGTGGAALGGSTPARAVPAGSRKNDSTRHLTTSSTELSRTPVSVTTTATSPWSTSSVASEGRGLD